MRRHTSQRKGGRKEKKGIIVHIFFFLLFFSHKQSSQKNHKGELAARVVVHFLWVTHTYIVNGTLLILLYYTLKNAKCIRTTSKTLRVIGCVPPFFSTSQKSHQVAFSKLAQLTHINILFFPFQMTWNNLNHHHATSSSSSTAASEGKCTKVHGCNIAASEEQSMSTCVLLFRRTPFFSNDFPEVNERRIS